MADQHCVAGTGTASEQQAIGYMRRQQEANFGRLMQRLLSGYTQWLRQRSAAGRTMARAGGVCVLRAVRWAR